MTFFVFSSLYVFAYFTSAVYNIIHNIIKGLRLITNNINLYFRFCNCTGPVLCNVITFLPYCHEQPYEGVSIMEDQISQKTSCGQVTISGVDGNDWLKTTSLHNPGRSHILLPFFWHWRFFSEHCIRAYFCTQHWSVCTFIT